eukprot:CAMPEP_0179468342 /NCGR_PEP_ID=MMETSP0799-20121207/49303_1 /TAXON_ID=46947 /ORGANISM="Geminigera cryophila, Strain CCMP2564" /LENGTH=284 /DNA_ID=CAMNT_0021274319 /DNA_START=82 /DNA_END=937 /DNA_ORIENTATION=-
MIAEPMYCAEQINIPDNLGEILKAYAKEVIRQQPGNLYEFSARYFAQLDQQEDDFVDNGDAEISREIVFRLVMACNDAGREEIEVGNLRELCEQSGVPLGATSGILELILPPDDTSGRLPWKHFVVALCAQVGGVEDVTGFVRLLLDPGMFGNDEGQISKTDFITLIDWWSSIDTSISAELKSALFTALNPTEEEVFFFVYPVGGVEDVTGFVRLLLDPGMFGNDEGQISKTDFITLIDWWSSIDTSISAELKSALFTALNPTEEEELMDYTLFMDALKNASGE